MDKPKHAKGPFGKMTKHELEELKMILDVMSPSLDVEKLKAKARKLANDRSALLAALKPIVDCYGHGYKDPQKCLDAMSDCIEDARAAIAKALQDSE